MAKKPAVPSRVGRPPARYFRTYLPPSLAKSYSTLPSLTQWKADTNAGRVNGRANDPMLRAIDELISGLDSARDGVYLYLLGQLFFTTMTWINNYDKSKKTVYLDQHRADRSSVLSLNLFAGKELARTLNCGLGNVASRLRTIYGVEMSPHGVNTDTAKVQQRYLTDAKREEYRAFIISGRVYNFRETGQCFKPLRSGSNGYGFALSMSKKLYVGTVGVGFFVKYHSCFMGGRSVQCAGTIWIENGRVTKIKNSSGHYKPVDTSMVKVLNHLRVNGIAPRTVTVETVAFINKKGVIVADERHSTEVRGDIFLRDNGNWEAILKRARHQPSIDHLFARR